MSRLQNNGLDPDDSTVLTSVSYPNSAANVPNAQSNGRQAYSAPQDPFGFKGPNSILPKNGPGDGPSYGRAKMQAERNRIRQIAMGGSLMSDPMENVSRRRDSYNQAIEKGGKNGYNPSMYEADSQKRGKFNFA